jgi:Transposase DDE domain
MIAPSPPLAGPPESEPTDPVVRRYRALFALLDWNLIPERAAGRPWPGRPPHPPAAYVKALLVKLCEQKPYLTQLRAFLLEHPRLVLELGFRPVLDPTQPDGFRVAQTVPGVRWLRHQQRTLATPLLHRLLQATVHALQAELPDLGTTVAVDVKHIYAWVQENNPKAYCSDRYNAARPPRGDPDCRLGVKCASNQGGGAPHKTRLWGYGTGLVSATARAYGDVVLAELTQPFDQQDLSYYHPLYQQVTATLGHRPTNVAADAAFDAWHVYQTCAEQDGIAAIPLNLRGQALPDRLPDGTPRCAEGLPMVPFSRYQHEDGYQVQRYGCPILRPHPSGATCAHPAFQRGAGCVKVANQEVGGLQRATLDRHSPPYHAIYRQRTAAERLNSQATALGIERPKVRNGQSVRCLNTLTYVLINLRALQRIRARKAAGSAPPLLC